MAHFTVRRTLLLSLSVLTCLALLFGVGGVRLARPAEPDNAHALKASPFLSVAYAQEAAPEAGIAAWKASAVSADCSGPVDAQMRMWYQSGFDDSFWTDLQLPDTNTIPSGQDRYYRYHYNLSTVSTSKVYISSDDGMWLYVNEHFVGHWGADCHGALRADQVLVDITAYLHTGDNLITAHVSNGPGGSLFNLVLPPRIILPASGMVTVNFVSTNTDCTGDYGMYAPKNVPIYNDYKYQRGVPFPIDASFDAGQELVFYIIPHNFCGNHTYLSTDPSRSQIKQVDAQTWQVFWEDWTDADFNDLVVQIDLHPMATRFLDLPFAYTDSTFANESRDTEQGGKVNSYFDHQYPTYTEAPNSPGHPNTVNFCGYDSSQTDPQPPYRLAYDGHDGIDYQLGSGTPVLAAAHGQVTFKGPITAYCFLTGKEETANVVKIQHDNNYSTEYWHLSAFASGLSVGSLVDRDAAYPIGNVGSTGCSSGPHLHFVVRNPAGVRVDPYGWDPLIDAKWYGVSDPWHDYESSVGLEGTSYYVWLSSLKSVSMVSPSQSTVITSTSNSTVATFPVNSFNQPVRVELAEMLESASIPWQRTLQSFSLYGYTTGNEPVNTLASPVVLDIKVPNYGMTASRIGASGTITPTLWIWNAQTSIWEALNTSFDSDQGIVHATSSRIGIFALAIPNARLFLPVVLN